MSISVIMVLFIAGGFALLFLIIAAVYMLTRSYRKNCDVQELDEIEGHDFEYFCADLLKKRGFVDVTVTKGSGDYGVMCWLKRMELPTESSVKPMPHRWV